MMVATVGHIDHGKTALVKALTGIDTDRLPEEKKRGLSIDLGFACLPLDDGQMLGFVDVPGHERFLRNMLAGVIGVDCALLVVAAADALIGTKIDDAALTKMGEACSAACNPISDKRGTKEYRIKTAAVIARRAVEIALERAREN